MKLLLTSGGITNRSILAALAAAQRWAAEIGGPAYAIDEQTASQVVDGTTTVISEGNWTRFG